MKNLQNVIALVSVLAMTSTVRAQGAAADHGFPLSDGKFAPLSLQLKDLDSTWRVFTASSSSYESLISSAMGGGSGNHVYTKGETTTMGTDVFLIAYKPEAMDFSALMAGRGTPPKAKALTESTMLKLSLLNLHALASMDNIQVFNLKEQIAAGKATPSPFDIIAKPAVAPAREPESLKSGSTAPDFVVKDRAGKPVKLSAFRGKVVVLDFWSTWCGPCQESLPSTNAVAAKYAAKGVVVIGLNVWDTKKEFDKWLPQHKAFSSIKFAIDTRPQGQDVASKFYRVTGIPTQYVIDRKGRIVTSMVGYSGDDSALTKAIKSALARK